MKVVLSKSTEVPLTRQLADQIVFLITTERLRAGDQLPSVRALARQLKVHHNTVSAAYRELVDRKWLVRRRGTRLEVLRPSEDLANRGDALDVLIHTAVSRALEMGFSLQEIKDRVAMRLRSQPPDHVLLVEDDPELRSILKYEVQVTSGWPVRTCSLHEICASSELSLGAQIVVPHYALQEVRASAGNTGPIVPISFFSGEELLGQVGRLSRPSVIAVVSISERFLKMARSVVSPVLGLRHEFVEHHLKNGSLNLGAADLIICDSVTFERVTSNRKLKYQLISDASLQRLRNALPDSARTANGRSGKVQSRTA